MELTRHMLAIHEAGHAAAAWALGRIIDRVTVSGIEPARFCCFYGSAPGPKILTAPDAFGCLAGAAAESVFGADDPMKGMEFDLAALGDLLKEPADEDTAAVLAWHIANPGAGPAAFADAFMPRVKEILNAPRMRDCIEAASAMLEVAGTVSGKQVVALFEHVHGEPLPALARPSREHGGPPMVKTRADLLDSVKWALSFLETAADAVRWHDKGEDPLSEKMVEKTLRLRLWAHEHLLERSNNGA